MAGPILVPCLVTLRGEFNLLGPRRDKASDGWLGDRAHALTSSDHNGDESGRTPYEDADNVDEVHGLDVDDTGPWINGFNFDAGVELIRANHERGRDDRLQNIIRNGRIASRSWGWTWRDYGGPNGHYEHAHFSARYTTAQERDTSPWGLEERWGTLKLDPEDKAWIEATVQAAVDRRVGDVVPRLGADGKPLPLSDDNPTMTVNSALYYVARDLDAIKKAFVPPA